MTIKVSIIIGTTIAILLTPTMHVYASVSKELTQQDRESGFYNEENGYPKLTDRPAINPDFDPDEDCNLEYHLKCIPGSEQDCPEGYHNGEDNVCSPMECQEGYHSVDDDETGLCYPNSEGCDGYVIKNGIRYSFVFIEDEDGDRCADPAYLCNDDSSHEICREYLDSN